LALGALIGAAVCINMIITSVVTIRGCSEAGYVKVFLASELKIRCLK